MNIAIDYQSDRRALFSYPAKDDNVDSLLDYSI